MPAFPGFNAHIRPSDFLALVGRRLWLPSSPAYREMGDLGCGALSGAAALLMRPLKPAVLHGDWLPAPRMAGGAHGRAGHPRLLGHPSLACRGRTLRRARRPLALPSTALLPSRTSSRSAPGTRPFRSCIPSAHGLTCLRIALGVTADGARLAADLPARLWSDGTPTRRMTNWISVSTASLPPSRPAGPGRTGAVSTASTSATTVHDVDDRPDARADFRVGARRKRLGERGSGRGVRAGREAAAAKSLSRAPRALRPCPSRRVLRARRCDHLDRRRRGVRHAQTRPERPDKPRHPRQKALAWLAHPSASRTPPAPWK